MKRAVIRVQHLAGRWHVGGESVPAPLRWHTGKSAAVAVGVLLCRLIEARHPQSQFAQLVVHGRDGRIQWESTYPRSSDPRRSRG